MAYYESLTTDDTFSVLLDKKKKITYAWLKETHKANFNILLNKILEAPKDYEYFLRKENWDTINLYFRSNDYNVNKALKNMKDTGNFRKKHNLDEADPY